MEPLPRRLVEARVWSRERARRKLGGGAKEAEASRRVGVD
jgi:hypothetical protein